MATPSIVVFTPHGIDAHYGSVKIHGKTYPIDRESALSHLFFKVTDAVGNIHPKTNLPTRSERFYDDPGTYFDAIHPIRQPTDSADPTGTGAPDESEESDMSTARLQRQADRERFLAAHAAFYDRRNAIMEDPGGYIKRRQEQAHMCSRRMSSTLAQSTA